MPFGLRSAPSIPTTGQLKGTAFEYLESATPPGTRDLLLPLLEADAENRLRAAAANGALEKLLASTRSSITN